MWDHSRLSIDTWWLFCLRNILENWGLLWIFSFLPQFKSCVRRKEGWWEGKQGQCCVDNLKGSVNAALLLEMGSKTRPVSTDLLKAKITLANVSYVSLALTFSGTKAPLFFNIIISVCSTPKLSIRATVLGTFRIPLCLKLEGELTRSSEGIPAQCENLWGDKWWEDLGVSVLFVYMTTT